MIHKKDFSQPAILKPLEVSFKTFHFQFENFSNWKMHFHDLKSSHNENWDAGKLSIPWTLFIHVSYHFQNRTKNFIINFKIN